MMWSAMRGRLIPIRTRTRLRHPTARAQPWGEVRARQRSVTNQCVDVHSYAPSCDCHGYQDHQGRIEARHNTSQQFLLGEHQAAVVGRSEINFSPSLLARLQPVIPVRTS
jgi:hypothetical protein